MRRNFTPSRTLPPVSFLREVVCPLSLWERVRVREITNSLTLLISSRYTTATFLTWWRLV